MPLGYVGPNGQWVVATEQPQGGFLVIPNGMLYAARPLTNVALGTQILFSDVGGGTLGTAGGSVLFWTGTRYKPVAGVCQIDNIDTANAGIADTNEQQLNPNHAVIPAGLLMGSDRLRIVASFSKSGGADTATIRFRFGPLGTTADPVIATITALTGAMQSYGTIMEFKRASATTIQKQGAGDPNLNYGGASVTAYPAAVTVSDMGTNPMYLSVTSQMTGGTEFTTLQDMTCEFLATDS